VAQKKVRSFALDQRRELIGPKCKLSICKQCELLGVGRSSWYYEPRAESTDNMVLMRELDRLYTRWPFYGVRRMTLALQAQGWPVNHKRTRRLMRIMGLEAIYPKPRLSCNGDAHPRFPYLLKGLTIERSNQVWCSDITYIGLAGGFIYLFALMDWYSRYVLEWELSNTLESNFCVRALRRALKKYMPPQISNTDQGVQFTSAGWIDVLTEHQIAISMDGRDRVFDNIFVERLWRSLKYEEVYLNEYRSVTDAWRGISEYFSFYNDQRPHSSLENQPPAAVYCRTLQNSNERQRGETAGFSRSFRRKIYI
jgi:putative transposase